MADINKRKTGSVYEDTAADYLISKGLIIIQKNFRTARGEIDIIARDKNCLVFAEVKYRKTDRYGGALYAVNRKKQNQIKRIAGEYIGQILSGSLQDNKIPRRISARYDVIAITGDKLIWIPDAFR